MNYRMIGLVMGRILLTEAALLILPLCAALIYRESAGPWIATMALLIAAGGLLEMSRPSDTALYAREEYRGRLRVEAGSKPRLSLKIRAKGRVLDEARAFVRDWAGENGE